MTSHDWLEAIKFIAWPLALVLIIWAMAWADRGNKGD